MESFSNQHNFIGAQTFNSSPVPAQGEHFQRKIHDISGPFWFSVFIGMRHRWKYTPCLPVVSFEFRLNFFKLCLTLVRMLFVFPSKFYSTDKVKWSSSSLTSISKERGEKHFSRLNGNEPPYVSKKSWPARRTYQESDRPRNAESKPESRSSLRSPCQGT